MKNTDSLRFLMKTWFLCGLCGFFNINFLSLAWAQVPLSPPLATGVRNATLKPAQQGGKWGYVDPSGKFAIPPQFESANSFSEGIAQVELNKRVGWIDTDGHFVIQPKYFSAGPFKEGFAWVLTRRPWTPLGTGEYGVALFGHVTFIDHAGREIRRSFSAEQVRDFSEGLAAVRPGKIFGGCSEKVGYLNTKGDWSIRPQFDEARDFSEGLAAVNQGAKCHSGGKWGYIGKDGKLAIPFRYDFASQFKNGHACVKEGAQWKRIDKNGTGTPIREDEC
jgi:hypothetical protein